MHLVAYVFQLLAFWRGRLADQDALLVSDIGLSRAEEQAFLALRRSR